MPVPQKEKENVFGNISSPSMPATHLTAPPLSHSLRVLCLGDNRLNEDAFQPLSYLPEIRVLNLSYNAISEVSAGAFFFMNNLVELYLSGNGLNTLPGDEIMALRGLRLLHLNANKLQTLPAELGKLGKLTVLDVGSNALKYNVVNWPYDWNWNWNLELKFLNLSDNAKLEIRNANTPKTNSNLADFGALTGLRVLGLMDITIMSTLPEDTADRRIRTSQSRVNGIPYGMADTLGTSEFLQNWDIVIARFRGRDNECVFGIFEAQKGVDAIRSPKFSSVARGMQASSAPQADVKPSKYIADWLDYQFINELSKLAANEPATNAIRRTFLMLNKELGTVSGAESGGGWQGASAMICYIADTTMYIANVGDCMAVLSSVGGQAQVLSSTHNIWNADERSRVRRTAGRIHRNGKLNGCLSVTKGFGHFPLSPVINADPHTLVQEIRESDEFVILASRTLWDYISPQTAVDIARTERSNPMLAAEKLRDYAISYGADEGIIVMVITVKSVYEVKKMKRQGRANGQLPGQSMAIAGHPTLRAKPAPTNPAFVPKNGRRGKDVPGDSVSGVVLLFFLVRRFGVLKNSLFILFALSTLFTRSIQTLARLEKEIQPPVGQIALIFTDIKNSSRLWDNYSTSMRAAIRTHNAIMRRALRAFRGYEVKTEGDAFMVSFQSLPAAVLWALTVQCRLLEADWPKEILNSEDGKEILDSDGRCIYRGLSIRMGLHWGAPVCEVDPVTKRMDYFGPIVNRAARISGVADGGQVFVSADVISELKALDVFSSDTDHLDLDLAENYSGTTASDVTSLKRFGFEVVDIGERKLKGLETTEMISMVSRCFVFGGKGSGSKVLIVDFCV